MAGDTQAQLALSRSVVTDYPEVTSVQAPVLSCLFLGSFLAD